MDIKFIAEMRKTNEIVVLCEGNHIDLYKSIMRNIEESTNISRFAIVKNNDILEEKWLRPKEIVGRRRVKWDS